MDVIFLVWMSYVSIQKWENKSHRNFMEICWIFYISFSSAVLKIVYNKSEKEKLSEQLISDKKQVFTASLLVIHSGSDIARNGYDILNMNEKSKRKTLPVSRVTTTTKKKEKKIECEKIFFYLCNKENVSRLKCYVN